MLRTATAAAAVLAFATAAAKADVIATVPFGDRGAQGALPTVAGCGKSFVFDLNMQKGKDYVARVYFDRYGDATLRTPQGKALGTFRVTPANDDNLTGKEYRAPVTGIYTLTIVSKPDEVDKECRSSGEGYYITYRFDCLGGPRTQCVLPVGATRTSRLDLFYEYDWFRTTLKAGQRYTVTSTACPAKLTIRDGNRKVLATSNRCNPEDDLEARPSIPSFTVPTSGTYFVSVEQDFCQDCGTGNEYQVSLKAQ